MLDRTDEQSLHPRTFLQPAAIHSVLCVAPHPDDEVLGCGGLLALLGSQGCRVNTLILTAGESGGAQGTEETALAAQRRRESCSAASQLGLPQPAFAAFPDRGLVYAAPLIDCIESHLQQTQAQWLLLPVLSEPHPDHQATSLAGLAAATRVRSVQTILFYEVGAPTSVNCLVDITAVASNKWQALATFVSQMGLQRYEDHAQALATLRAFGSGAGCLQAEGFFRVDLAQIRSQGPAAVLPHWPLRRIQVGLANVPQQMPLVSVLIRSMDRPVIAEALASVLAQTYANIEIVVVNASGRAHNPLAVAPHRAQVRLVQPPLNAHGTQPACSRACAANLALAAAQGEWALFLDDDDLIDATHIERLVACAESAPAAVGAYSGIRVEGPNGVFIRDYDHAWSHHRLNGINFLPIHAVLIRMAVVREHKVSFDETLPVLEDWEFWRTLCVHGPLQHCPGVSGRYRQGLGESHLGSPDHAHYWKTWHRQLIDRHVHNSPLPALGEAFAWHAIELDRTQTQANDLVRKCVKLEQALQQREVDSQQWQEKIADLEGKLQSLSDQRQMAIQSLTEQLAATRSELAATRSELAATRSELAWRQGEVSNMQHSLSWRLTRPLRLLKSLIHRQ